MTTPEQIAATQRTGLSDAQLCVLDVLLTNEGTERGRAVAVVAALREAGMLTDAEAKPIRFYTRTIADLMRERDSLAAQLEAARQAAAEVQRHWQYGHQTYLGSGVAALIRTLAAPVEPLPEPPAAVSLPEEAEPAAICGWRLTEWDRCTRPADHEGACA